MFKILFKVSPLILRGPIPLYRMGKVVLFHIYYILYRLATIKFWPPARIGTVISMKDVYMILLRNVFS